MRIKINCLGLLLLLCSCSDYLDKTPSSAIDVNIDSEEKVAELITAAYPSASYFAFLEARTDNVEERAYGIQNRMNEAMFFWEDFDQEDLDTPLNYWNSCYTGIAQVNKALELLSTFPKNKRTEALYAEAFLLRAYLHFMLVNIWSEPYGKKSASQMGIPYLEKPEKHAIVSYDRGTVKDVYDKIEKDLLRGVNRITDQYYKAPRFHFSKRAAYAFASRFYLMKGDWQKVIDYSNYVLGEDAKTSLRRWWDYRRKLNFNFKSLHQLYLAEDEPANLLLTTTRSRLQRNLATEKYGLTADKMVSIFAKRGIEGAQNYSTINLQGVYPLNASESPITNGSYMAKFDEYAQYTETGSSPKQVFVTNVLFSTDEVLLNRMEAYTMLSKFEEAIADLLDYMSTKFEIYPALPHEAYLQSSRTNYDIYSPNYGLSREQLALISTILHFRQKEFMHEGLRWFDIRRFYLSVKRNSKAGRYKALEKEDLRKVLQIPNEAIRRGLQPNPRNEAIILR